MTAKTDAKWFGADNNRRRRARLENILVDAGIKPSQFGPTLPADVSARIRAVDAALDRLALTNYRAQSPGGEALLAFANLSQAQKARLAWEVFETLEYNSDGNPGNEWGPDTTMQLGQVFDRYGVTFTDPNN